MQPWQEDNVIFFKVAHINERAGYLGEGVLGSGVYRYIITPYYLLYSIFGYKVPFFYALDLIFFFLATVSVYFLGKSLINRKAGMLASYLFACGYVAYDGFVRVYNSISSSLGIIFLSLLFAIYWKFYKSKNWFFYLLAIIFYWFSVEFSYIRSHYLIFPILVFEFLLFNTSLNLRKLFLSALKVIPFVVIFYKLYLVSGDSRTASTLRLAKNILEGKLENTFSFFATLGNLIVPDKFQNFLLTLISRVSPSSVTQLLTGQIIIFLIFITLIYLVFHSSRWKKFLIPLFAVTAAVWFFLSREIYTVPNLIYSAPNTVIAAFIGGLAILLIIALILVLKGETKKLITVLFVIITANIAAYCAYTPTTPYPTGYRYLAHSNVGWIMILVLLAGLTVGKKIHQKAALNFFIVWGLMLLTLGVTNMQSIVNDKSRRIESFYQQLKGHVGEFPKGSLILFDIQDDPVARSWYDVSFSVAEMPDTTAIAWRWGIDRYDIRMFTEFSNLISAIKDNSTDLAKVYTFFLTKNKLYDTTAEFRQLAKNHIEQPILSVNKTSQTVVLKSESKETNIDQADMVIDIPSEISNLVPLQLDFRIKAVPLITDTFPIEFGNQTTFNSIYTNPVSRLLAFEYQDKRAELLRNSSYSVSSQWKDRVADNLHDNDLDTVWQSDRILWANKQASLTINLGGINNVGGLAWVNGFPNNTPTKYKIEISLDGKSWKEVYSFSNIIKINSKEIQQIRFKPSDARFMKVTIEETLSGDSPAVAEVWVIPSKFSQLNIEKVESFLSKPFYYIADQQSFMETLKNLGNIGNVKISWMSDKSNNWISTNKSTISVWYDGVGHLYSIVIPPSGTRLKKIKLSDFVVPGQFGVEALQIKSSGLR